MRKRKPRRMQELALEPELAGSAVDRVAGHREVDRRQVNPDLVRAPGFEPHAQQRMAWQQLLDVEVRHRVARRVGVERLPQGVVPVSPDRCVDRAASRAWPPDDEGEVLTYDLACLDQLLEPAMRLGRARD